MNRRLYALHRWIGLLALLQLAAWTVSGFFFAVVPIERVRGEDRTVETEPAPLDLASVRPFPAALRGATKVSLETVGGRPVYLAKVGSRRVALDARTGSRVVVGRAEAARVARADQQGSPRVASVVRVEHEDIEYRGKPVPAWCVTLDDGAGTRIYVDAVSGQVTARRNDVWRAYDFLWSLHIMDYGKREDFNHPLLIGFAGLGALTVVSGLVLWIARLVRRLRRGPAPSAPAPTA